MSLPTSGHFIVLDEAPIKGSPTPKYQLLYGDPSEAVGGDRGYATTISALLRRVPVGEKVWRVFLQRTDGKTGGRLLKRRS